MPRQYIVAYATKRQYKTQQPFSGIILREAFRQDYTDNEKLFRTAPNFAHHIHARAIVLIY